MRFAPSFFSSPIITDFLRKMIDLTGKFQDFIALLFQRFALLAISRFQISKFLEFESNLEIARVRVEILKLQFKSFAQIQSSDIRIFHQFIRFSGAENFAFRHNISSIRHAECFAHVVIGD